VKLEEDQEIRSDRAKGTLGADSLPASMVEAVVEAVLFAAAGPLTEADLRAACEAQGIRGDEVDLERALAGLGARHDGRAIELVRSAGGYRFRVRAEFAPAVHAILPERPARLSRATLETLAIIVYRQPVTRAEIEEVRGVVVSTPIMRGLVDRGWVQIIGHREVPGRPALYGTTRLFLDDFGLSRLDELPPLDDIREWAESLSAAAR
jgi:segregation and condensation protein B